MSKCKKLLEKLNKLGFYYETTLKDKDWFSKQNRYKTNITNWGIYLIDKKTKKEYGPFKDMDHVIIKALELERK